MPHNNKTHNQIPAPSHNEVDDFLSREEFRRQSNKVLHGHPSPLYWKPLSSPTSLLLEERANYSRRTQFEVNLYVGTPFCIKTKPARCGFCLFPSEDYEGNRGVETYLDYLQKEFDLYRPYYSEDKLGSIYFGGGTPNLYRPEHYDRLMKMVDDLYGGVPSDIEITLEGIPQLFTEPKIRAMKEAGFNRVSIGVQQFNDKLIKYSGRRQTLDQVYHSLELSHKYDLANNVDLIYGWPEQTLQDMLGDLKSAVDAGVHHITHYELNIAGRSNFSSPAQRKLLPTIPDNIEMYLVANEFLKGAGFEQVTVYDWRRIPKDAESDRLSSYSYEHNMHEFVQHDNGRVDEVRQVCGIGYAAVNFHPNGLKHDDRCWIYMNQTSLKEYCSMLDRGEFPVGRGFVYKHDDVKLAWLFQSMQTMKIDHSVYNKIFKEDILDSLNPIWTALDQKGWINVNDSEIEFIGAGQYYIPLIQSLVAFRRLAQIRGAKSGKSATLKDIPITVV